MIFEFLSALAFGLGVALTLFGSIFCYKSFIGDSQFENPLIPMGVSFGFIATGLMMLYLVIL